MIKNFLDEINIDSCVTHDNKFHNSMPYNSMRWFIDGMLAEDDGELPFLSAFKNEVQGYLKKAGFSEGAINDVKEVQRLTAMLDNYPFKLPSDCPASTPEIEAALHTLAEIEAIRPLLHSADPGGKEIYLRTIRMVLGLLRSGRIAGLVAAESTKKDHSLRTRELKKLIMNAIIANIFEKNPHRPKTLGEVWNKISSGYECVRNTRTGAEYIAKTGKNAKGQDIVSIIGDVPKPIEYSKRSLQRFINELK